MDWLTTVLAMILGLLLRVAIPIAATILLVIVLKWLDERWKREADLEGAAVEQPGNIGCWDVKNCPSEQLAKCRAYANPDTPCWQVFREDSGKLCRQPGLSGLPCQGAAKCWRFSPGCRQEACQPDEYSNQDDTLCKDR